MIPYNKRQDAQIVKIKDYINGKGKYVTGEGTSITLENTVNTPFNNIILKGNTSQNTTTGKNLLNGKYYNTSTQNGITLKHNNDNSFDITGTATSNTSMTIFYSIDQSNLVVGNTYYFYMSEKYDGTNLNVSLITNTPNLSYWIANNAYTIAKNQKFNDIVLYIPSGVTMNYHNVKFMIVQGSTTTSYEPYTGGIASPNPDYPQDINVVTGDNTINIINSNIYNLTKNVTKTDYGFINNTAFPELNIIKLKKGIKYLFSLQLKSKPTTDTTFSIYFKDSPIGKSFSHIENYELNKTYTIEYTSPEDNYLYFHIWGNANKDIFEFRLWINVNEAQEFEFYNTQSFPISLGSLELCKIGDYQDYFYKSGSKWYKHKTIDKIEDISSLRNSTYYAVNNDVTPSLARTYYSLPNCVGSRNYLNCYCNKLKGNSFDLLLQNANNISTSIIDNVKRLDISISQDLLDDVSLAGLLKKIKEISPIIYYACIPTEEEITDTTLISQLNELEKAVSYNDTTNISQTNANLPFIINAEAVKKLL